MEHKVYICRWKRTKEHFAVWVTSQPQIRGEGANYAEAEERLIEAIQSAGGAMQAVLEFDPPLPKSAIESRYTSLALFLITGDDSFQTEDQSRQQAEHIETEACLLETDTYYQSPICRKCKLASSPRTEKPLSLTYAPSRYDGAFGSVGRYHSATIEIVSEGFLDLLTPEERGSLELRQVLRQGRARKFFELLGPAGPEFVAVAGLKIAGWRCSQCDHREWGYWIEGMNVHSFIAASDLPSSHHGVFTIGRPPEIHLAVTASRWKELVGRKGTRGFASQMLGVVADNEVIRTPDLPTSEERLREGR